MLNYLAQRLTNIVIPKEENVDQDSISSLSSGQFFRADRTSKINEKCIFVDSVAEIKKSSIEFNYLLVISQVVEEGQDAEEEDEFAFLIDSRLDLRVSANSLIWTDQDGMQFKWTADRSIKLPEILDFERVRYHLTIDFVCLHV